MKYDEFLNEKAQLGGKYGFETANLPEYLFDFQRALVSWALTQGRGAILADCGLGKTPMQLVWAENIVRRTNGAVLILTPLSVAQQTLAEAEKFGIECKRSSDGSIPAKIVVTNYERLHHFDPKEFVGVVCDESSILKSFDGARRNEITAFMRKLPYRLLCTATAAPNDYVELGTSSEALGELGHVDMLNRFFKNDQNTSDTKKKWRSQGGGSDKWRFKGHAEKPFWRWVASWARACRKPSDLGFEDGRFVLPDLVENEHVVKSTVLRAGTLFELPAVGLWEEREERRRTIKERCEKAADLVGAHNRAAAIWCHLNPEGDLLEKLIPDSIQVSGSDSDESKEEKFLAFSSGQARVIVIKPKIGAFGLNWQHCAHVVTFPSHSFEQYYQLVRRCWRFGQEGRVVVDLVATEGERGIKANLQRKADAASRMFEELVSNMSSGLRIVGRHEFKKNEEVPSWL